MKSRMSIVSLILFVYVPLPIATMIGMHHHKLHLFFAILNFIINAMRFLAIHRSIHTARFCHLHIACRDGLLQVWREGAVQKKMHHVNMHL